MRKLKALVVLAFVVLVVGAVAAPASPQTGTADIDIAAGAMQPPQSPPTITCGLTFDWDKHALALPAGPGQTIDIHNMATTSYGRGLEIINGNGPPLQPTRVHPWV